jgi:uncharacterized protein (TIGR02145 family)
MYPRYLSLLIIISFIAPCKLHPANKPSFKTSTTPAFIENKGQIIDQNNKPNPAVLYLLTTPGFNIQLRRGGFSYDLYTATGLKPQAAEKSLKPEACSLKPAACSLYYHRIDFDLLNANPNPIIETSEPSPDYMNYYTTGTPVEGITHVQSYASVTYKNIYPGIDLQFVADNERLFEYNFILQPGADINSIRLKLSGPEKIKKYKDGIHLETSIGEVDETIPVCYYSMNDIRVSVKGRFKKIGEHLYGFSTDQAVPAGAALFIDPIPTRRWGTYYASVNYYNSGCVTDNSGNVIIAGTTFDLVHIATAGAYQTLIGGAEDACLAKFSTTGQRIWGTYFGGSDGEVGNSCSLDKDGNIFLIGYTSSTNGIATPGAHQTSKKGNTDSFIVKFTSAGMRTWGTYFGGNEIYPAGWDYLFSCATDTLGNVYCFGATSAPDFIATPGASQTIYGGGISDGFLTKFSGTGQQLWGTYYGGSSMEQNITGTVAKNGFVYISGNTGSPNNIATPGSFMDTYPGPGAFLGCFDLSGQRLWGTYFAGLSGGGTVSYGCAADTASGVFFCGTTSASSNIATSGTYQPVQTGPGTSGYLEKFSSGGQRLWGTYYGSSAYGPIPVSLNAAAVDDSGNVYITGNAILFDPMLVSTGAYQSIYRGGTHDAILAKFNGNGQRIWGTYYGGTDDDLGVSCAADHMDNVYMFGWTFSENNTSHKGPCTRDPYANIIATPNSLYPEFLNNGFLVKFADCWSPDTALQVNGPNSLCQNSTGVVYSIDPILSATGYHWCVIGDLTITSGQNTTSITIDVGPTIGVDTISVYGINSCDTGFPKIITRRVYQRPVPLITGTDTTCTGFATLFTTKGGKINYQWTVSPGGTIVLGGSPTDSSCTVTWSNGGAQWIRLNYSDTTGCNALLPTQWNVWVITGPPVSVSITSSGNPVCAGAPVTYNATGLNGGSAPSYLWKVNGTNTGLNNSVFIYTPVNGDVITCIYTSNLDCASNNPATSNAITMVVNPILPVSVSISLSANPVCAGIPVTFTAAAINGGPTPFYQWKVNGANVGTDLPIYTCNPASGDLVSCILTSNVLCPSGNPATSNTLTMIVNPNLPVSVSISASANPFCQGSSVTFTASPVNGGTLPSFQWKVNGINAGSNNPVYTYNPASGDLVSCILTSNIACPAGNPATSNLITMIVNANLPAGISIAASTNPFCPGNSVTFTATPVNGGTNPTYQWKVNGANAGPNSPTYTYNPASGDLVSCILTSNLACVTGNPATSNTITMSGTLAPVVTFTRCFDSITTTSAKPFKLKGGIPLGGNYSGPGVSNGIFSPAIAGTGTKTILYTYSNAALCSATNTRTIIVISPGAFVCGNNLTDIRDNKSYPTVQIGAQCWMAEDLNYGYTIDESTNQRDNCIPEKYIRNSSSVIRNYYQWDELMQYDETVSAQGLCPPGWHVPTEADWSTLFGNYISNGFAGSPLKYSGFSGFNAILSGARHLNKNWDYQGFATFFWSSTSHGPLKAWSHGMNEVDPSVSLYPALRSNAFSVRCCKD